MAAYVAHNNQDDLPSTVTGIPPRLDESVDIFEPVHPIIDSSSRSCWNFQRLCARLASLRESYCPLLAPLLAASSSFTCHRLTRMSTNKDAFLKLQGGKRRRLTRSRCAALGLRTFGRPIASRRHRLSNPLSPSRLLTPSSSFLHFVGLRAMSCLFPGLATTLQKKTHLGFEWTTRGGGAKVWDFSNGPASFWVSLLFRVVCSTE